MIKQQPIVASPSATSQQPGQLPAVGQNLSEFDMAPSSRSRTSCRVPHDPAVHPDSRATSVGSTGAASARINDPGAGCDAIAEDRRVRPQARQGKAEQRKPGRRTEEVDKRGAAARDGEAGGDPATARCGFEADTKGVQGWHVEAPEEPATGPWQRVAE